MSELPEVPVIPRPSFSLEGRVAMVTGANKGIGHDRGLALGGAGTRVVATGRRPEALADMLAAIEADGERPWPCAWTSP